MPRERGCAAGVLVVRRFGAAQQPDRAAPHTGVPEIGAALCLAAAPVLLIVRTGSLNTVSCTPTGA